MKDGPKRLPQGGEVTEPQAPARRSLRQRLFWSHLSVAAITVALLLPLLGTNVWLGQHIDHLTHREVPAAEAAVLLYAGVERSSAALNAWVAIGDAAFKQQRDAAWDQNIRPSFARLRRLIESQPSDGHQADLERLAQQREELDELQQRVANIAQMSVHEPITDRANRLLRSDDWNAAGHMLATQVVPLEQSSACGYRCPARRVPGIRIRFCFDDQQRVHWRCGSADDRDPAEQRLPLEAQWPAVQPTSGSTSARCGSVGSRQLA